MRDETIRVAIRSARILAAVVVASIAMSTVHGIAADAPPTRLTVLDFGFFDTSGEPRDQTAEHQARLARMTETLRTELAGSGLFAIIPMAAEAAGPCPDPDPERDPDCILARARELDVEVVLTGVVHKTSTMELGMWISGYDAGTAERVFYRQMSFRGDTDESWRRASLFLARQLEDHAPELR